MKKLHLCLNTIIIILLISFSGGCKGKEEAKSGESDSPRIYTVADPTGDWGFPTPFSHYLRGPGYTRMSFIFDTLTWKDEKGITPGLADRWTYNHKDNSFTFYLTSKAKWHDSKPFTAEDVRFTFAYIKKHPYPWIDASLIKQTKIINSYCIKIYLTRPYASFITNIAGTLPIIPHHIYSGIKSPATFNSPEAATGTGPYILISYNRAGGTYRYRANRSYYRGTPAFDELRFIKINSEMAGNAFKMKKTDAASVPPEIAAGIKNDETKILRSGSDWIAKVMINHKKEILSKSVMRQALIYAIDRNEIVKRVLRSYGKVASSGLIPQNHEFYNRQIKEYTHSIDDSKRLIRSLGYKMGNTFFQKDGKILTFELLAKGGSVSTYGSACIRTAEMIRKNCARAGINLKIRILEPVTVDTRIKHWQFDLALSGHGGMGADPQIIKRVITGKGFNSSRFYDKRLSLLLNRQEAEMDKNKRMKILHLVQKIYSEKLPAIPLYYPDSFWIHNNKTELFYTYQGIATGIPIPLNKAAFLKEKRRH